MITRDETPFTASIGKTKAGKHPGGYGETSSTNVRSGKLPKKVKDKKLHYDN